MKLDKARKNFIGFVFFFFFGYQQAEWWVLPQNNTPSGANDN
jgi:hypothetical protein